MKSLEILRERVNRVIDLIADENETTFRSKIVIKVTDIPLDGTITARGMLEVEMWPEDGNNCVLSWCELEIMNRYFNCIEMCKPMVVYRPIKEQIMMKHYFNYK